ncbi:MAG TPA: proline--tRNA ligase [bacterium]|nr:proline--tRNA ligase [bacterium]HPL95626.1 proline--tRNA ligase [bacterium]
MPKITSQKQNFSDWYNDVVIAAGLADYSDVKGCMIIKPYGYALWENIQKTLDEKIKALGVDNVYLPLFIPESYFKKEAEHVEGFAPEVAWVTEAGGKKLEERLAIRPTSETIMYKTFANWISSYRDLPLKVNQWANIVRWEMRTRLFLRTTEFLWQEGHTLHATKKEADEMVDLILKMYQEFVNDYLAIAVIPGLKPQFEKFAGADYTKSIEGIMKDGKALQMGTSHSLGQKFAQTFDINFLDQNGQSQTPWPTSWGVSTRLIGGLIMAHGDEKGLIIPPKIAPIEIIIIPIFKDSMEKEKIQAHLKLLTLQLKNIKIKIDWDETKSPGWKFNEWELKGVPLRLEIGPQEVAQHSVVLVRRDTGEKITATLNEAKNKVKFILKDIQKNLLKQSYQFLKENTVKYKNYASFKNDLATKNIVALAPWCGRDTCAEQIKNDTKATIRVYASTKKSGRCLVCQTPTTDLVYLAKSY